MTWMTARSFFFFRGFLAVISTFPDCVFTVTPQEVIVEGKLPSIMTQIKVTVSVRPCEVLNQLLNYTEMQGPSHLHSHFAVI